MCKAEIEILNNEPEKIVGITEIKSRNDFKKRIKKGAVLVNFTAPWCAPCKSQEPIIEELASKYKGRLEVIYINIEIFRDIALELNVGSIPTLIMFLDGLIKKVMVGVQPGHLLEELLEKIFKNSADKAEKV